MKNLLLISFFCFSITSFSQNILNEADSTTIEFIRNLKSIGVVKNFSMKTYCRGIRLKKEFTKNCQPKNNEIFYATYVVWSFDEKVWIKKFDNCGSFEKVELIDFDFDSIFNDSVKELKTKDFRNNYSRSHTCFTRFKFYHQEEVIKTYFDLGYLTDKENGSDTDFEYNTNLKVFRLYEKIDEIIQDLEFNRVK